MFPRLCLHYGHKYRLHVGFGFIRTKDGKLVSVKTEHHICDICGRHSCPDHTGFPRYNSADLSIYYV